MLNPESSYSMALRSASNIRKPKPVNPGLKNRYGQQSSTQSKVPLPCKKVRTSNNKASRESKQPLWHRMMMDIQLSAAPVKVLHDYHHARKFALCKETIVGTLSWLKRAKDWKRIAQILEWLQHQSWWTFNELDYHFLIAAYGKLGEPKKVEEAICSMKSAGFHPNVASYTSLIEAYGEKGFLYEAEGILNDLREELPKPTTVTYQMMIKAFIKKGKHMDAERIYETLISDDYAKPDQKLFNLMIYSHGKCGQFDKATQLLQEMNSSDIPMSVATFNSLLSCLQSPENVNRFFLKMRYLDIQLDVFSYASRLNALCKARKLLDARFVFDTMIASGIRPNCVVFNILLDGYAKCRMIQKAEALLEEMNSRRCKPDVQTFSILMNAYVNAFNMDKAEAVMKQMKLRNIQPNVVAYGTLIKGYAEKGNLYRMMNIYVEMCNQKLMINEPVFNVMLRAFGKHDGLDRAMSWFKEMTKTGFPFQERAQKILLTMGIAVKRKEEVVEFIESLL